MRNDPPVVDVTLDTSAGDLHPLLLTDVHL